MYPNSEGFDDPEMMINLSTRGRQSSITTVSSYIADILRDNRTKTKKNNLASVIGTIPDEFP